MVTGGSRGPGRGIALALAQAGAEVVVGYVSDASGAEDVLAEVRAGGGRAVAVAGDVTDPATHERLLAAATGLTGHLDIWVNNAGVSVTAPVLDTRTADMQRMIDVNLVGVVHGCRTAGAALVAAGRGGRIICISSDIGVQGVRLFGGYVATKFAVVGLCQSLALELAPHGITVNSVCPGTGLTDMVRAELQDEATLTGTPVADVERAYRDAIPLGRFCEPADVGALVAFLAGDAAGYITGQALLTNGGAVLR